MAEQPEPIREYYVGGVAVPINEVIGVRILLQHEDRGRGPEFTSVTANIALGDDVYALMNRVIADVDAGLFQRSTTGSPRGPVMVAALPQVVIGGYDSPNYPG